jgi:hypothetical protein
MHFVLDTFLTKPQEPAQKAKLQIDPLRNEKYFLGVRHTPQNYFVFILMRAKSSTLHPTSSASAVR